MQAVYNVTHDSDEFVKDFMIAHEKVNIYTFSALLPAAQYSALIPAAQYSALIPAAQYSALIPAAQYSTLTPAAHTLPLYM